MALVDEKYRDLINSVHGDNLEKFKSELQKIGNDFHPKNCLYVKTQDNVIHVIAQLGRVDFLLEILKVAPDLFEMPNLDGKTPLHEAAQFCQYEIAKLLLANNVKVDPIKRADWTPLMLACTKTGSESLKIVQILIEHGANVNLFNKVSKCKISFLKLQQFLKNF